jgi:hypothetical protein
LQFRKDAAEAGMPSYSSQIAALFSACTDLRQTFIAVHRQAEMVHELAMNASLTAAQTGTHVKTCTEIAYQISITGKRMRTLVEAIRVEVNQITNLVLTAFVHEQRLEKYREALAAVLSRTNASLLQGTIEVYVANVLTDAQKIANHIHQVLADLRGLDQCQSRLFVALCAFEIESTDLYGADAQIIVSLVESLQAAIDDGAIQIQRISRVVSQVKAMNIVLQEVSHKELIHAKIRAA